MTTTVEPQTQPAREAAAAPARQFVNFMFFKIDRSYRRESAEVKAEARREFAEIVKRHTGPMMVLPYSTVGIKPNTDFMFWRIGYDIAPFPSVSGKDIMPVAGVLNSPIRAHVAGPKLVTSDGEVIDGT